MASDAETTQAKRTILLGVSGGIAAYKAADLASKLTGQGYSVHVIMTASACELVRPRTFEAVTGNAVHTSLWSEPQDYKIGHVHLADAADMVIVAPATANIIAKAAQGICDDLLSTTLCVSWQKPILLAPAMNTRMWENPVVQKNIAILRNEMKMQFIGPAEGRLACGDIGAGRMAEPAEILAAIQKISSSL